MRRSLPFLASLLAGAALLTACGGGGGGSTATAPPNAADGAKTFASAGCSGCHTLKAAGANGSVGPNLDDVKPSAATVEAKVRAGGGGMPAFKGRLSGQEIANVAAYVSENAGK